MSIEESSMSMLDILMASQQTHDEAKKKAASETSTQTNYFRMDKDGKYLLRVLPLVPVIDADGKPVLPMERTGYEYPIREQLLKIDTGKVDSKGKDVFAYVNVIHTALVFNNLTADPIDKYVQLVNQLHSDDTKLCKTLAGSSYNNGIRYDYKHSMYVLNLEDLSKGIQVMQISHPQYKELEAVKLDLWSKLSSKAKGKQVFCPLSSIQDAYTLEVTRGTEGGKTTYRYSIDVIGDTQPLDQKTVQALFDAPRLPELQYRYTRRMLEGTIVFLKQMDARHGINIMAEQEMIDCLDQVKMNLPADDQSHFSIDVNSDDEAANQSDTFEQIYAQWLKMEADGVDDRSDEGNEFRTRLRTFVDDNDIDIHIKRQMTNGEAVQAIADILGFDSDANAPAAQADDDDDPRNSRNDDTNEPAVRVRPTHPRTR
jgi:hypothetical protein